MKKLRKLFVVIVTFSLMLNLVSNVPIAKASSISHNVANGRLVISSGDGNYTITGKTTAGTANMAVITVQSGYKGEITLDNVNISLGTTNASAMDIQVNAFPTIILKGTNSLTSGSNKAGIGVPEGAGVTIQGLGHLTAQGGEYAAGIGGGSSGKIGTAGTNATSGTGGSGTGYPGGAGGVGGNGYNSGTVIIMSGNITALGGSNSSGIGGGGACNGGAGGTGGTYGSNYGGIGGTGGAGGNGGDNGTVIILGGTITATGSSAIGGGRGGVGGVGGTGGYGYKSQAAYRGIGGTGGVGGKTGSSGNIIMVGGKLAGSTSIVNTANSGGTGGAGRASGKAGSIGTAGTIGNTYILTDTINYSVFGKTVVEHRLRTTDYRANANIYADFTKNTAIYSIVSNAGLDAKKLLMGITPSTDGSTSAYIRRGFYSNLADTVSTTFFTDAVTKDGELSYQGLARTVTELGSYTDIAFPTQTSISYDGNGYTSGTLGQPQAVVYGNSFRLAYSVTKKGHDWVGWNTKQDGSGTMYQAGTTITSPFKVNTTLYAQWKLKSYKLSYNANGGNGVVPQNSYHYFDTEVTLYSGVSLEKEGFVIAGWGTSAEGIAEYKINETIHMGASDLTLYAFWIPSANVYRVDFESNGGSVVEPLTNVFYGAKISSPLTTKLGHEFDGWYKESQLINRWNFSTDSITRSQKLYAKWNIKEYKVIYDGNTATSGSVASEIKPYDSTIYVKDKGNLEKTGYLFNGWSRIKGGDKEYQPYDTFKMGAQDITFYAVWVPAAALKTVTFETNGGTLVNSMNVKMGSTILPPETTRDGYVLEGWYKDLLFIYKWDFANDRVTSDLTLYAAWTEIGEPTESENVALNKLAIADSVSGSNTAKNAVDGRLTTRWGAKNNSSDVNFEIDLGSQYTINKIKINEYGNRINNYVLEYWDGSQWLLIQTGDTMGETFEISFSPVTATKVKLLVVSTKGVYGASIHEFEVWTAESY